MIIRKFVLSLWLLLVLSACGGQKLNPQTIRAAQTYYAQSVSVTPGPGFSAGIVLRRGTPDELARYLAHEVQTGLQSDLQKAMRGRLPAAVSVTLTNIHTGPSVFQSPKTTVQATVTITDAASGATVVQFPVTVDDSEMQNRTNANPLAALAGSVILDAVTGAKDLTMWHLARMLRGEIKVQLGSKSLF
jgi:uncharacterized protein YceK